MELFGGLTDIAMTPDGDMILENNDLKSVKGIDWCIQEINKILKSSNDWAFAPNAGVALDRFYGAMNTRDTASQIESLITSKITQQRINFPATVKVTVVPLSRDSIKIYISLNYSGQVIPITAVLFDLQQGIIYDTQQVAQLNSPVTPNKHPYSLKFL